MDKAIIPEKTPVCYRHNDRPALAECVVCRRPLCEACLRETEGRYYCDEHLPQNEPRQAVSQSLESGISIGIRPVLLAVVLLPAALFIAAALLIPVDPPELFGSFTSGSNGTQFQQITGGLEKFEDDVGRYPTEEEGLDALREEPENTPGWLGPYLPEEYSKGGKVVDGSGKPVGYELLGDGYMLTGVGADGEAGTGDDVAIVGPVH